MAKLKVFSWSDGLHDFTVAASSRPKALQAWGVSQDLFKTGLAHEAPDAPDAEAALARPGEVVERARTLDVPRTRKPGRKDAVPAPAPQVQSAARPPAPPGPSAAELRKARALETELTELRRRQRAALRELESRRAQLEREARRLEREQQRELEKLEARLQAVRARL